jgi:tRNA uridine 5-carbamoylmethylation protein Kti12
VAVPGESPVLILTGAPGAGKTTAARALCARFDRAAHLQADVFFDFIQSGHVEPWKPASHEQNTMVMGIVADTAGAYAAGGYLTIVEGIIIPGWFFEPLRDSLRMAGHPVAYAFLRASLASCLARAASRETQPLADPQVVERLWHDFADLGPLERNAIDTESRSPEETADLLAARLRSGLLAS